VENLLSQGNRQAAFVQAGDPAPSICYRHAYLGKRKMRALAKTMARRIPLVRGLFDQPDAALAQPDRDPAARAEVAVYGPDRAGAMTERTPIPAAYAKTATYEDIFYCFRLLLGRNPNPEEWPGHFSRVGEDLESVVSSYVTSREFAERGLLNKTYRDQVELVRLPRFSLFASNDDLAVGRHVRGGSYEPGVAAVLMRYVKPGMSVVDIGANIGYFTMLLASLVEPTGVVVAVEPNPENIKLMEASRRVNGFDQVLIIQAAAGRHTGLLSLNVSHSNGMTGELSSNLDAVFASRPVPCFALDGLLPKDRPISLVKIDTEGAELNALIGLSQTIDRDHPVIVSEFSPGALPGISRCSGPEYLRFLSERGYRIGVVEQNGSEQRFGDDVDDVMGAYSRSGIDHIDIVATPT
jgi:FkbM family methyltransferase